MNFRRITGTLFLLTFVFQGICRQPAIPPVQPAAVKMNDYLDILRDRNIALVANHTSLVYNVHLLDTLVACDIKVVKVFSPEHGFRGSVGNGVKIKDTVDSATGVPVISLYGSQRKPSLTDLEDVDLVVYDIQDVGARFYTYISTLHLVMEACAEAGVSMLVLDRPNPNGFYVDGPVLDTVYRSFVGMDPVPVVYGMTPGEYALMLNGEGWIKDSLQCGLTVIKCRNYTHRRTYKLPVAPSPNLPTQRSVYLYPSLCFLEGTIMSVGRGTDIPFEIYGHPEYPEKIFSFVPEPKPGASMNPKYNGVKCYGVDLSKIPLRFFPDNKMLVLDWLMDAYHEMGDRDDFFTSYFTKLAGTDKLQKQIEAGKSKYVIRASWKKDLEQFKKIRKKYLLYPDFE